MVQMDHNPLAAGEVLGQFLCAVGRTVLAAGTPERDLQVGEAAADETLHMGVDQREHVPEESEDLAVGLEELLHLPVQACHGTETLVFPGIVYGTAVEDVASSVAGQVVRDALLVGETVDMHVQEAVRRRRDTWAFGRQSLKH